MSDALFDALEAAQHDAAILAEIGRAIEDLPLEDIAARIGSLRNAGDKRFQAAADFADAIVAAKAAFLKSKKAYLEMEQ